MPLHVLQLGPYPPPEGGISRNMLAIRDELLRSGNRCSIIATSKSSTVRDDPDVYHPRSKTSFIGLLRRLKCDALHLHIGGDVTMRVLALAYICSIFGGKRSVLTLHSGGFATSEAAKMAKPLSFMGFIFRRFSRVIAVNEGFASVFRRFGVPDARISVIAPFALQLPDEDITVPKELAEFCKAHSPLLLAVGGLEKDYDPLTQIAAMKGILADLPNAGLMIVGSGSMKSVVEAAVEMSGCADYIYLAGNVDHTVTLHLMKGAEIVLRTTLFDGDAISVREALFLGTPVIATDTGNRPEGVHLIAVGDKQGLRTTVQKVISEPVKKFATDDGSTNIKAVIEIYKELAGDR